MIKLADISRIYFIGIGGIGMSAIARHFNNKGVHVSGYDKTRTVLSHELEQEGMSIHYEDNLDLIDKDANVVVYTPAVPADHTELNYYRDHGYKVIKRSDILEILTADSYNICVAGTHGKTTISSMIAHILRDSGKGCTAFLGGIGVNYHSNYWYSTNNICVVEADEYDRSFLKLSPDIAVISAMDPDHLDIYGTAAAVEEAFIEFAGRVKPTGILINKFELIRSEDLNAPEKITYSLHNDKADVHAKNIQIKDGGYYFDVVLKKQVIEGFNLAIGGMHNVENAIVAIGASLEAGVPLAKVKEAVASYKGVKRRFEYLVKGNANGNYYIDDYAHHPEELRALIISAKNLFPTKKCIVLFQPHLYSRTRDLVNEFAEVLDLADEVILLPLYPARELPIEGVSSKMIIDKMNLGKKHLMDMEEVEKWIGENNKSHTDQLYITAGAGNIDQLVIPFQKILMN